MRAKAASRATFEIEFTKDELTWINNALNEVCIGLDLREFGTRMGAEKPQILKLLHRVSEVLQRGPEGEKGG